MRAVTMGRDHGDLFLDGVFRHGLSGETSTVLEKATGERIAQVALANEFDVDAAVRSAETAQAAWALTSGAERSRILRSAGRALEERANEFADCLVRETGGIRAKGLYEIRTAIAYLHEAASLATRAVGEILATADPERFNTVTRKPMGVVAVITPWNLPLLLALKSISPAIALGNSVVLKPAPSTPVVGGLLIAELFAAAGLPPGVLNVVPGGDAAGVALVAHARVDMIHFTGSTQAGRRIAETAGGQLKRVALELGGNNALVVLDDADPGTASMVGAWSSFHYQGQTCISAGRHIVARALFDEYVQLLANRAHSITVGDPAREEVGLGPMISEQQRDRAHAMLRKSIDMGARVVEGGTYEGLFYRPTVVVDVTPEMPIYTEEIFAPIAPVVAADSDAHALELVNGTPYGLSSSVLSTDVWRARRFAARVKSGMVHVNETTCLAEANVPFVGTGISGLGPGVGGDASIEQFTERQWISVRQTPPQYMY